MLRPEPEPVKRFLATIPRRIVSGGQTGVDRAALDVALALSIECGGWCSCGRLAEDGPIDPRYLLRETQGSDPSERTKRNVADADATLILASQPLGGGTALTLAHAGHLGKSVLVVQPNHSDAAHEAVVEWLRAHCPEVLNVAGPRESESPGIYRDSNAFLTRLWTAGAG